MQIKNMKKILTMIAGTVACLGFGIQGAVAMPVLASGATNQMNFNVSENIQDTDHSGTLSSGDLIYGILNVTRISSGGNTLWNANNVPGPGVDSLSGYFVASIASVTSLPSPWAAAITFAPAATDPNHVLNAADLAAHTVAKLFTDTGTPFTVSGNVANDIATATDGLLWSALGLNGGNWDALLMKNGLISAGGGFNFTANNTGMGFSPQANPACPSCTPTDFYFSTIATDNGPNQGWRYTGGNNGTVKTVPEPPALLLMVAGLLGWVVSRRGLRFASLKKLSGITN